MHTLVCVVGPEPDEQMNNFSTELVCEEELVGELSESEIKKILDHYNYNIDGERYTDLSQLKEACDGGWNGNTFRKNETTGKWEEFSSSNPNGHFDWWQTGGRWPGRIIVKEGVECEPPHFSYGWDDKEKEEFLDGRHTDSALLKDIDNLDELLAAYFIQDGEIYDNYEADNCHFAKLKDRLSGLPGDTLITFIDAHE